VHQVGNFKKVYTKFQFDDPMEGASWDIWV